MPAAARRVGDAEALLHFAHPAQRNDRRPHVPGHQLGVAQGRQGTGDVQLVAVLLGVLHRLPRQRQRPVQLAARRLGERGQHGGGHLADPGVAGEAQALAGQVEGAPAVPGVQFGLGHPTQEVHLALDRPTPAHLAQQGGDRRACLRQLVAHDQPAEPGVAGAVVMARHPRVLRLLQRPPDGRGRVRVAHQRLDLRLEGERHQLGVPVAGPPGQLRRVRRLAAGLVEVALHEQGTPGELVVDQGEQPRVLTGVGQGLREDRVDLGHGVTRRVDHDDPGPHPVLGHGRAAQHLAGDVPGEVQFPGGDRVLGGRQAQHFRVRRAVGRRVPRREQAQLRGDRRRAPVPGLGGGLGEPGRHLQVGAVGREGEMPGAFDGVGGRRGQRGVRGPALLRGRLRVQGGGDHRVCEPYGGPLGLGRQQPEFGGLGGLGLCVVPAGRVQQRQRGTGARARHEEGAAGLLRQHLQAVEHQGAQRGGHRQRFAGTGRGRVLGEGAAQFEGEQGVAAAGAVDVPDRGAGQTGVAAVVEQRGQLGARERAQPYGEGVRWGRA